MKDFRILVVDDDQRILNFLRSKLKASGYDVLTADSGAKALDQVQGQQPHLMVLDLIMPKMNGFDVLREVRRFSQMPVIILTARGTDVDKIKGLTMGADDYLAKPFNPDELVARIEAVRRRVEPSQSDGAAQVLRFGEVVVNFRTRAVKVDGQDRSLTRIEWLLLSQLAHNAGRLMPYEELLTKVWGPEYRDDVQLLRTWVSRLRSKLQGGAGDARLIRTMPKAGYIIDQPAAEPLPDPL